MDPAFVISEEPIAVADYQRLRAAVGWWPVAEDLVAASLAASPYSLVARLPGEGVVGIARMVGDPMYLYVQDMIVRPRYQGQGLGRALMERILSYWDRVAGAGSYLGLMCARGQEPFYARFGFEPRPPDGPGMQRIHAPRSNGGGQ